MLKFFDLSAHFFPCIVFYINLIYLTKLFLSFFPTVNNEFEFKFLN